MKGQRTECYSWIVCPICHFRGLLQAVVKTNRRGISRFYYRVTHYIGDIELKDERFKGSKTRAQYDYTCYLGVNYR